MSKLSLNPTKGFSLKKAQGWIRKTIGGKRKRVKVDFVSEALKETPSGIVMQDPNGKTYTVSAYDIRNLADARQWKTAGDELFNASNRAGMNFSRKEALNLITERFNLYMKYEGWKAPVAYIYSKNSRVIRGTENLMAVRLRNGTKGWLTPEGVFLSQDSYYQLMQGLDGTVASGRYDFSFAETWERMSAQQRAEFVDMTRDVDWDVFWQIRYDREDPLGDSWVEAFTYVAEALLSVVS